MPIKVNGRYLRDYIGYGAPDKPRGQLPIEKYEEALRLKEDHTLAELANMWGLTKEGAASRVRRARRILDAR